MSRVAVMGGGSWGTAFSMILADAGNDVVVWARQRHVVDDINLLRENREFHPGVPLPEAVRATTDPIEALHEADVVVLALPAQALRENLRAWGSRIEPGAVLLSLLKGIEMETNKRMSEVVREVLRVGPERVAVLSGPNLAREIAAHHPAASVIACADEGVAEKLQAMCMTGYFRPYTHTDVVGVELGGAVKNVIALAVGMAEGMGFGDNSKATIITRGLAETIRLGLAMGAEAATFSGLAGLGDLTATCMSPLSRNRTFGENIGKGKSFAEVVAATKQTAEGVKSCRAVLGLARAHGVEVPITEAVVGVLYEGLAPREVVTALMNRTAKHEQHGLR